MIRFALNRKNHTVCMDRSALTYKNALTAIMIVFSATLAYGQALPNKVDEMKLNLNESGSHFLKWTFSNQVWVRFNDSNPGTMVLGEKADQTVDIGLRRTRIQFFGQITDHVFFYTQFGQNNFNFLSQNGGNRKLQAFFHDALGEYKVWKDNDKLKFGGGLTIANGLSRFSQPSVSSIMTMDVPVFAQATVDQTDEFSRKLSIYARGQIGKVDYRLVMSDPFPITTNGQATPAPSPNATFSARGHHKQYQAFLIYNFLDKESHTTPYMTGTYLGKKKVLNLEAGIMVQNKAMWTQADPTADTTYHQMKLWSAAVFYDAPLNTEKGTAISLYAGYFAYDFGPNYLRYNGIMNPASAIVNGPYAGSQGNAFPMFGTGNIFYGQAGYLMRSDLLGEGNGTLMPYVSIMQAKFDRMTDATQVWSAGVNWLIKGHNSKLTLDYQNRTVFKKGTGTEIINNGRKSQVVLQYQIFI
jgi:hypothetical protein